MPYKAVIFDLYGTLVGNFSRQAYDQGPSPDGENP